MELAYILIFLLGVPQVGGLHARFIFCFLAKSQRQNARMTINYYQLVTYVKLNGN